MAVVDTILNGDPWTHIEVDVGPEGMVQTESDLPS